MKKVTIIPCIIVSVIIISITSFCGQWKQDNSGWWYDNGDSTFPVNAWKQIDGKWYYFNQYGYMASNQWIDGLYYLGNDGAMMVNTITPDGYRVGSDGARISENTNIGNKNESGKGSSDSSNISFSSVAGTYTNGEETLPQHTLTLTKDGKFDYNIYIGLHGYSGSGKYKISGNEIVLTEGKNSLACPEKVLVQSNGSLLISVNGYADTYLFKE